MIKRSSLPELRSSDVFVYGATVGGILAAIAVVQDGKTVVIVDQHPYHIGGMHTGGISLMDNLTDSSGLMPLAHNYLSRIAAHYGESIVTFMADPTTTEPSVALFYLQEMLTENNIVVVNGLRIKNVGMDNLYIQDVTLTDGSVVKASRFIDASYEGDLIRRAGVSITHGREANAEYTETFNGGLALDDLISGKPIDPYITAGDSGSGLLPGVQSTATTVGEADKRISGYNYRLCMTKAGDKITPPDPSSYDANDYEYLGRLWAAGHAGAVFTASSTRNGKFDFNANGPVGTNIFGETYAYPLATYDERDAFSLRLKNYILGLFKFIREDSRAPPATVADTASYGFAADEFTEGDGFPPQVYVRESNRLVGDYVFSETDFSTAYPIDGVVGCGYPFDSHYVSMVDVAGVMKAEGHIFEIIGHWVPLPFSVTLPKTTQCKNLAATFCLSATHVGFGTTRMEFVSMGLGEAAGHAASISIDKSVGMPDLHVGHIQSALDVCPAGILMDALNASGNGTVTTTGVWTLAVNTLGDKIYGRAYQHDAAGGKGTKSIKFEPTLDAGDYEISIKSNYANSANRSAAVPIDVKHSGGTTPTSINQKIAGSLEGEFQSIGTYTLLGDGSDYIEIQTTGTTGAYVVVNAVCFRPISGEL